MPIVRLQTRIPKETAANLYLINELHDAMSGHAIAPMSRRTILESARDGKPEIAVAMYLRETIKSFDSLTPLQKIILFIDLIKGKDIEVRLNEMCRSLGISYSSTSRLLLRQEMARMRTDLNIRRTKQPNERKSAAARASEIERIIESIGDKEPITLKRLGDQCGISAQRVHEIISNSEFIELKGSLRTNTDVRREIIKDALRDTDPASVLELSRHTGIPTTVICRILGEEELSGALERMSELRKLERIRFKAEQESVVREAVMQNPELSRCEDIGINVGLSTASISSIIKRESMKDVAAVLSERRKETGKA